MPFSSDICGARTQIGVLPLRSFYVPRASDSPLFGGSVRTEGTVVGALSTPSVARRLRVIHSSFGSSPT